MRRVLVFVGLIAVVAAGVVGVSGAGGAAGSVQTRWVIRDLGVGGEALAINNRGQVVGNLGHPHAAEAAFFWQNGKLSKLGGGYRYAIAINERGQVLVNFNVDGTASLWTPGGKPIPLSPAPGGCTSSMARALNERGQIVGWSGARNCEGLGMSLVWTAVLWTSGRLTSVFSGSRTEAVAINDADQVVVNTEGGRAYLWQRGKVTGLRGAGAAINSSGQIVGTVAPPGGGASAFLWQKGKMVLLGSPPGAATSGIGGVSRVGDMNFATWFPKSINDRGQVVGTSGFANGSCRPFLWQDGRMIDLGTLPGGKGCEQPVVNERGQIAGTIYRVKGKTTIERAYVWENGKMTDLGTLGGANSFAAAINDHGQIVGSSTTRAGQIHAVIWTPRSS